MSYKFIEKDVHGLTSKILFMLTL